MTTFRAYRPFFTTNGFMNCRECFYCRPPAPAVLKVTLAGLQDGSCLECNEINGEYELTYEEFVLGVNMPTGTGDHYVATPILDCRWRYAFPDPPCGGHWKHLIAGFARFLSSNASERYQDNWCFRVCLSSLDEPNVAAPKRGGGLVWHKDLGIAYDEPRPDCMDAAVGELPYIASHSNPGIPAFCIGTSSTATVEIP